MLYEVKDLSFSYNRKQNVLNNLNLSINEGDLVCVLGKNGAGKTTLFNCLLGILNSYQGQIFLNSKDIKTLKEADIAKLVGYVPQSSNTSFAYTVLDYVLMGLASQIDLFSKPDNTHIQKALKTLDFMGILDYKDRLYMELSGGEKQQVTIARAIVGDPKILFFDEPTAHLDYANQTKVLSIIKNLSQKGYAIIFSSHDPNQALMFDCDVVLFDSQGHIEKGKANDLITEEKLKKVYGSDLVITYVKELKRKICSYKTI